MRPPIASMAGALIIAFAAAACASSGAAPAVGAERACTPVSVDSAFAALAPVYRDCDVDRPATVASTGARPDLRPQLTQQCMSAELEFVVDERGRPLPDPVHIVRTNSREFAQALIDVLPSWRYTPAEKNGEAVRQVVRLQQSVQVRFVAAPMGTTPVVSGSTVAPQPC
ncbi:MAG TPA: hypothetical protein VNE60_11770 [Gemmatimonadaceae bacterium]|nr:hypothetical protein [Gemmatimonadaceae bacterium]